jgi:hypothetical protein
METPPTNCPDCGGLIKHIKSGISKNTGKRYSEFWPCENKCGFVWRPQLELKKAEDSLPKDLVMMEKMDKIIAGLREIYAVLIEIKEK